MPANTFWNIAIGPYAFTVDRRDLTYRLEETETGTVWADGLSLGTIEVVERDTGTATVYSFGAMQRISLSEKSGATGKRILFGMDVPGRIPVDVYLTCTEREIQLTVEANRDTKTHRIGRIVLVPGLCTISDDGASHLVLPYREGAILLAKDAPEQATFPIWEADQGLSMSFAGAVRSLSSGQSQSTLALLTDSAYGVADLSRSPQAATLDLGYERDPERRRLDLRIVLLPNGDPVSIARAYRDKVIGDGQHISLRRKRRENPVLNRYLEDGTTEPGTVADCGDLAVSLAVADGATNRWEAMSVQRDRVQALRDDHKMVIRSESGGDWSATLVDIWYEREESARFTARVPLRSVIWRDAVPTEAPVTDTASFLRALLRLAAPHGSTDESWRELLLFWHRRSLTAFLTDHRFLTPDYAVEEARYSNGTHVVVNQSATNNYETADLHLPPGGFYISQGDQIAHHALRVGTVGLPPLAPSPASRKRGDTDAHRQTVPPTGSAIPPLSRIEGRG